MRVILLGLIWGPNFSQGIKSNSNLSMVSFEDCLVYDPEYLLIEFPSSFFVITCKEKIKLR